MRKIDEVKSNEILRLIEEGKTVRETADMLNIAHTTVERYLKKRGVIRRPLRRWTEKEREKLIKLYSMGRSYEQIAKSLGRSQNAIEIELSRRRKEIKKDPEKQRVLKVLSFCMNPGRVLELARKSGMLEELKQKEEVN